MPETLKKLREPAALAAVAFAGLALLVAVINLIAPPSGGAVSFADRSFQSVDSFLDVVVAAAAAFAVYLANHVAPALAKARLITLAALVEMGVALLFGVVTGLAQFGADGIDGESKFLNFLQAAGHGAVVAVAALFVWMTWQILNPSRPRPAAGQSGQPGRFGGGWPGGPGAGTGVGTGGQQYPQAGPPPGGFGWAPGQGGAQGQPQPGQHQPGQHQPGQAQPGQQPAQSGPTAFGQQPQFGQQGQGAGAPGAPQPFGGDRTQLLPPVQSGQQPQQFGQVPGGNVPGANTPGVQTPGLQTPGLHASGVSGSGSHQVPPPPTMQHYAAEPTTWSPSGTGSASAPQPPTPQSPAPGQGTPQQIPSARAEEPEQRPGPFQIGDWRSE